MKKHLLRKAMLNGLLHFGIIWTSTNAFIIITYAINTSDGNYYLRYADGTPVTVWQYFLNHNIYERDNLLLAIVLVLVEFNYQYLFRKIRLPAFIVSCISLSVIC